LNAALAVTTTLALQANYTWNHTERADGSPRLRRPRRLANVGLEWQPQQKWSLRAFLRSSRDALDQNFAGVIKLDNFAVLDMSASYQLTNGLQIFARIENALNEKYQEVINYNTPGSAAYIGFRMRFD
jgi:vitamin B12 transporter